MYNNFMKTVSLTPSGESSIARLFSRDAAPYWAVFFFALAIRIVHQILVSRADPMYGFLLQGGDNYTYDRWANEIAQQFWLGWDRIPFFHGPLYPYFLSLIYLRFGHKHDPAAWTQRLVGALTVVLIFYLARRLFGKKAGWFAGIGAAACPVSLFYEGELLVETLILFLHTTTLCVLVEAARKKTLKWWLFCGIAVGLCCVCRPNAMLLVPFAACWIAIIATGSWKRRALSALVFLATVAALIAPVTLATVLVGKRFFLVTYSGSYNLYIGNAPDAIGVFFTPPSMKSIREAEGKEDIDINWRGYLLEAWRKDPLLLPRKLWLKTKLFWQSGELPCDVNFYLRREFSPLYALPFRWAVVAPLGLVGLVLAFLKKPFPGLTDGRTILAAYLAIYACSAILVFVPGRLRMPALAILFMFAGYALATVAEGAWRGIKSKSARSFLYPGVVALILWTALGLALRSPDDTMLIRWNDYFNMGSACELAGDYEGALRYYKKASERAPELKSLREVCDNLRERMEKGKRRPQADSNADVSVT